MDCNKRFIQIAQLIQKSCRTLAIALDDLIGLSISLLHMHMDFGTPLLDRLLDTQQHLRADKVSALRAKQDLNPSPCLVVPFIIQINVSIQALLSHGIIKLIEFARLINPSFSRSNRLCNIPSGAHLIDESTHIFHFGIIVAQCGSACPDGLQNGHSAAHIPLLVINRVVKGLEAEHHPTVGVLGQSAHNIACSMHMAVDKTRQHHMMIQGDHFLSCIFR